MRQRKNPITPLLIFHIGLLIMQIQSGKCDEEEGLIESTCKRTPDYDVCVSTLESNPASSGADLLGLAHIMVDTVLSKGKETLELIRALLRQQDIEPEIEKSLAFCAELYIPVVKYSLPQAIEALIGGHFGFANYGLSDASKQAIACDKSFAKTSDSPLSSQNALFTDLSQIAASIINILLKG